ncbi:MAG: hypothetical protein PHF56_24300 [Desulfuromonadaceae bacterium]|nr:hypothetical protein [Desulfuromonadaceae bacterium]
MNQTSEKSDKTPLSKGEPNLTETRQTWKSRPVFISSTFKAMHEERDWLRHHVFPRFEEELRKRYHYLEPIDFRLGVEIADGGTLGAAVVELPADLAVSFPLLR